MQNDLIIISEYCQKSHFDPTFLQMLDDAGLINIYTVADEKYLYTSQLPKLEQYSRMYYDLSINIEGIDAIENLLDRIQSLQQELNTLRNRLDIYESDFPDFEEWSI